MTATWDYGLMLKAMLKAMCNPGDIRSITQNPWVISINVHTFAAATDGMRALYLETGRAHLYPETAHLRHCYEPCDLPHLANLLAIAPEPTHQIERSVLLDAIGPGDLVTWAVKACDSCEGTGKYNPRAPYPVGCHRCAGAGEIFERSDSKRIEPLWIGGMPDPPDIDAHLAQGVFQHLPGDPILLSARPGIVVFRGPGWAFLIAPLNTITGQFKRSVIAHPIQPAEPSA